MGLIGKWKILQLPKFKATRPIIPFTDFDPYEWTGKCLSQENLRQIPIYGNCGGIGGGFTIPYFVTKPVPQTLLVLGADENINIDTDHADDLTKFRINFEQGGSAEISPGLFFKLFPCTTGASCNYQWYQAAPSHITDFTPTLNDNSQIFGGILPGRYIGGKLLAYIQMNISYLTATPDVANPLAIGGGFGLETLGTVITDGNLASIEVTTRSEVVSALENLIAVADGDFDDIKIVIRLYWNPRAENSIFGWGGTGIGTTYLENEAALIASTISNSYITVINLGNIGVDGNPLIFSEDEVWSEAVDFFGIT